MKITIIGGGNIGSAIACGLASGSHFGAGEITVVDLSEDALNKIKAVNPLIRTAKGDYSEVALSDIVLIAVKPWLVEPVIGQLRDKMDYRRQLIISVAAGIDFNMLHTFLQKDSEMLPPVFQVIPNTAIAIRESMSVIVASGNATEEQKKLVLGIFNDLGKAVLTDESKLPAATALASCGIAFAFKYIRAAMSAGIELGFYPEEAKEMVAQTVLGAARMLLENHSHPETEIDKVTTPGGITIKGVNELDAAGFTNAVIRAIKASNRK